MHSLKFNNTYVTQLSSLRFYSYVKPAIPLTNPYLISFNDIVAEMIGLNKSSNLEDLLCANVLFPGSVPVAMIYAGHQFGYFTSQLGDGRALLLGEVVDNEGNHWALHAKGTGPTPYSRGGDGRAVLRSSIREYLVSEAMGYLNIPTTRALSLVGSKMAVYRETVETAAIVIRVAHPSAFVRFVKQLADYVIDHTHEFYDLRDKSATTKYSEFLIQVARLTGYLVAKWQIYGFTHGVLNTDNMSILGVSIDYGPYGFIEDKWKDYIPNHSDGEGRYAFDKQPTIGEWNLMKLVTAFSSLVSDEHYTVVSNMYWKTYEDHYGELMRKKLGLVTFLYSDKLLWEELLELLDANHIDYTIFWRKLADKNKDSTYPELSSWFVKYEKRLALEASYGQRSRTERMNKINPKYILRNYLAHTAILKAQKDDFREVNKLLRLLRRPFDEQPEMEQYSKKSPEWAKKLVISCSS
ncbi:unnamed protein product [Didymodactylos carnosus]|uniref:Selenoprotein O n=1 Tax=Didymodactylos carnosus TaxID=1234261 RepID=A0A8S2DPT4_9BILA|nr:unnamed protein product [Didymodactylos carnosus]CAF3750947.1 unnamed protein product [Didymodactylos carnosus]